MTDECNKEAFNEQVEFLKMLAQKLGLDDYNRFGAYLLNCTNSKSIDFLNIQLFECIDEGKLINWVIDEAKDKPINEAEGIIDIKYFWRSYCHNLSVMGLAVPSNFSDEEIRILEKSGHIFRYSLWEDEDSIRGEDDNGDTVFAYTETRRYM